MDFIAVLTRNRAAAAAELAALVAGPESEERDLTADERTRFETVRGQVTDLDTRIGELRDLEAANATAAAAQPPAPAPGAARVTTEPRVYRSRREGGEHSFLVDAYRNEFLGDYAAAERINRHRAECDIEARAVTTGNLGAPGGLVPPVWLQELYAPIARAGRPFANECNGLELPPEGMTLNIPRFTTGTTTAIQATENASVSSTDAAVADLAVPVRTIAGQQDISRQSLERGTPGIDQMIFMDLAAAFAANLDSQVISGSGAAGQILGVLNTAGINAVTYTDATPTVPEAVPKIADAIQQINALRFFPASAIAMHPRRWGWFTAAVDSQNRPLVVPNSNMPYNAQGVGEPALYGPVGSLLGLPVWTDANIPTNLGAGTNEDRIIVARMMDLLLWETGDGTPMELRFEQTLGNQLTVKLVVYAYCAFTAGRYPAATSVVSGTGLTPPTF